MPQAFRLYSTADRAIPPVPAFGRTGGSPETPDRAAAHRVVGIDHLVMLGRGERVALPRRPHLKPRHLPKPRHGAQPESVEPHTLADPPRHRPAEAEGQGDAIRRMPLHHPDGRPDLSRRCFQLDHLSAGKSKPLCGRRRHQCRVVPGQSRSAASAVPEASHCWRSAHPAAKGRAGTAPSAYPRRKAGQGAAAPSARPAPSPPPAEPRCRARRLPGRHPPRRPRHPPRPAALLPASRHRGRSHSHPGAARRPAPPAARARTSRPTAAASCG